MKKYIIIILLIASILVGCQTADILTGTAVPDKDWELIEESATDSVVNLYITDDDDDMKSWLNDSFARSLANEYGMEVVIKKLEFEDIVATLDSEKLNEVINGSIDLLILRDDEFTKLKDMNYLYEDIESKIPNFKININGLDYDVEGEHGTPLDGYGIPFGREQFILVFDEDELETYPKNLEELKAFVEDNENTFTYANPTVDGTGGEFLRTVVYEVLGEEALASLMTTSYTDQEIEMMIMPAIDYLKSIDPYLYKSEGKYLTRQDDIDAMFKEGTLLFTMSTDYGYTEDAISDEIYPDGANSFMFENGTIGDTIYMAIPVNASNKTGGIVSINSLLSLELQLDKYVPSNWGSLPVLDLGIMSETDAEKFSKASVKRNTLRVEDLFSGRYPELPLDVQASINAIWGQHFE